MRQAAEARDDDRARLLDLLARAKHGDLHARHVILTRAADGDTSVLTAVRYWHNHGCREGQSLIQKQLIDGYRSCSAEDRCAADLYLQVLLRVSEKGDGWAVTLLRDFIESIARYVVRNIRPETREDIIQDSCLKLLLSLPKYMAENRPATLRGLLYTIVRNTALNALGRSGPRLLQRAELCSDALSGTVADAASMLLDAEFASRIHDLYEGATDEMREIVYLTTRGYSIRQVAKLLRISRTTVGRLRAEFYRKVQSELDRE